MEEFSIQTTVQGRYLFRPPLQAAAPVLIAGFHGYGQTAEDEFGLLESIPGTESFALCSIEALHPFYSPKGKPGACWMTSRQRETRIAENIRYVDAVISRMMPPGGTLVYHGFSQGAGMASRAAMLGSHRAWGFMLLGGDFPPELDVPVTIPLVHIARGNRDPIYREELFLRDCRRFREGGADHVACTFAGVHEASSEYLDAAAVFLERLVDERS